MAVDARRAGEADLGDVGQLLFANRSSIGACHSAIGEGGTELVRGLIKQVDGCLAEPGAPSIAACFETDVAAWRAGVEGRCVGRDPFGTVAYPHSFAGLDLPRVRLWALPGATTVRPTGDERLDINSRMRWKRYPAQLSPLPLSLLRHR